MSRTPAGKDYTDTTAFIDSTIAPALIPLIEAVLDKANKILEKKGIRVGAEIQWFIEYAEGENAKKEP